MVLQPKIVPIPEFLGSFFAQTNLINRVNEADISMKVLLDAFCCLVRV